MTFVQPLVMAGMALVMIPVLIHLFNRRKAKVVDWGAMRFLTGSMVSRRRRVQIEELILLALRCLLVALIVLAVARPFVPVGASLAWMLLLPALLLAAIVLAVGTVLLKRGLPRVMLIVAVAAFVALLGFASQSERVRQMDFWSSQGTQDVAIVIDASTSMSLSSAGQANFDRAIEEARLLVDSLEIGDGVSIILAGSTPTAITPSPQSASQELSASLADLQMVGGSMSLVDALEVATATLARGDNAAKKIVVLTDGQNVGWDTQNLARWEYLQTSLRQLTTEPKVILRNLSLPPAYRNARIAAIEPSRKVIGVDRPVAIRVRVENTGTETMAAEGVRLQIGEQTILTDTIAPIEPGASETVEFQHQFISGGSQILSARILVTDDMPGDDTRQRVVTTFDALPVLLVDGNGAYRAEEQATSFIELALVPPVTSETDTGASTDPAKAFISTRVISAPDIADRVDLADYRVVVLANVARLPARVSEQLAEFVAQGGGLLVAPGRNSEPEFYNTWRSADGAPLLPARIADRVTLAYDQPTAKPSLSTFDHAALAHFGHGPTDLDEASFTNYWKIQPASLVTPTTGGNLTSGDPLLIESRVGRGRVAMTAISLDHEGGNLPAQMSFLPMVHELVYHLASPLLPNMNAELASVVKFRLPIAKQATASTEQGESAVNTPATDLIAQVTSPSGKSNIGNVSVGDGSLTLTLREASEPGIHYVQLPAPYDQAVGAIPGMIAAVAPENNNDDSNLRSLPIALAAIAEESQLTAIGEAEEATADRFTDLFVAGNRDNMVAALQGDVPGQELWKMMALGALLALLGENLVTRWIGKNRKTGRAEAVDFTNEGQRMTSRRAEAKELLAAARERRASKRRTAEEVSLSK